MELLYNPKFNMGNKGLKVHNKLSLYNHTGVKLYIYIHWYILSLPIDTIFAYIDL